MMNNTKRLSFSHTCTQKLDMTMDDKKQTSDSINISTVFGRTLDIATPQPLILSCSPPAHLLAAAVLTLCVHKMQNIVYWTLH
jgi:hypothetical protein